jgi:hypothetical protein
LPHQVTSATQQETREFLQKVIDILLDYVNASNDRQEKILDFHHPEEMKTLLDLEIADQAVPLQQLIVDCATTMRYQVKTGEYYCCIKIGFSIHYLPFCTLLNPCYVAAMFGHLFGIID